MEKLSRDEIERIGNDILENSAVVAKHGTSIACASSILDTGFNFHRTSYVVQISNNVVHLCSYGWKENKRGDSTNVIISIPKSFFMKYLGFSSEKYEEWISYIRENNLQQDLLDSLTFTTYTKHNDPIIGTTFESTIPSEFIKGAFVFMDNKVYLDFFDNQSDALNHLGFVENKNYFDNLSLEEQDEFIQMINSTNLCRYVSEEEKNN